MAAAPNSGIPKGPQESEDPQSTADMTVFSNLKEKLKSNLKEKLKCHIIQVQNLLMQMQTRFQAMSETIVSKNEMGSRIDELEQSINDLKAEMGADTTPAKAKPEENKPESAE